MARHDKADYAPERFGKAFKRLVSGGIKLWLEFIFGRSWLLKEGRVLGVGDITIVMGVALGKDDQWIQSEGHEIAVRKMSQPCLK